MRVFNFINFFKTRNGLWILLFLGASMILAALSTIKSNHTSSSFRSEESINNFEKNDRADSSLFKIKRDIVKIRNNKNLNVEARECANLEREKDQFNHSENPKYKLPYIDIYSKVKERRSAVTVQDAVLQEQIQALEEEPEVFAPIGRLLKCELVNTIDSCNMETPIIGIVTEDLYWNGHLIIPANTEVHGVATTDRIRQRIASGRNWRLVLPKGAYSSNGAILDLEGIALDREESADDIKTYGITDGSFGLMGHKVASTEPEEIKTFLASFLQGIFEGFQTTNNYEYGRGNAPIIQSTFRNASLAGSANVMAGYIRTIQKEIEEKSFYTRVPAGKQFYLYITETIEPEKAYFKKIKILASEVKNQEKSEVNEIKI